MSKRFGAAAIGAVFGVIVAVSVSVSAQQGGGGGRGGGGRGGAGGAGRGAAPAAPAIPEGPYKAVVIGCVKPATPGQDKDVIITDFREGGSSFHLDGTDEKIAPWTNATLEVHGTVDPGSTVAGNNPVLKLKADEVYVIARGCTLKQQ